MHCAKEVHGGQDVLLIVLDDDHGRRDLHLDTARRLHHNDYPQEPPTPLVRAQGLRHPLV